MAKNQANRLLARPFEKICRTCLSSEEEIFNIFEVTFEEVNLLEVFASYIAVQVEQNDGLPQNVCKSCVAKLVQIYEFIQQCESTDALLRAELKERSKLTCHINAKLRRFVDNIESNQSDTPSGAVSNKCSQNVDDDDQTKVVPFLEEPEIDQIETKVVVSQIDTDIFRPETSMVLFKDSDSKNDLARDNISCMPKTLQESDIKMETDKDDHLQNDEPLINNFCGSPTMKGYHEIEPCAFRFSCKPCKKYFDSLIKLKEHRKEVHSLPRKHVCINCNKAISSYHNLQLHMKKCKKIDIPIENNEHLESKPLELLQKLLEANNFPFTVHSCRKCNTFYSSLNELKFHRKRVKHSRPHNFACPKCSKTVSSIYNLKEHMKTHSGEESLPIFDLNLCTTITQDDQTNLFIPKWLQLDEPNSQAFSNAATSSTQDVIKYESDDIASQLLQKLLQSDKCANTFYSCKHCNEVFASYDELKLHQQETQHSKILNFDHVCPECNKKFNRRNKLKQHMFSHTKEKPFCCSICQMRFSMKFNLRRHMMTHTGERPFVCEFCGKGFIQADCLAEHRRVKHTGETPFLCNHCGKYFARRTNYQFHLKTHCAADSEELPENSPYKKSNKQTSNKIIKCNICQRKFQSTECLKQHMATHEEKAFLCSNCGKSFALKSGLLSHMKVHTGDKPYSCKTCYKTFSQVNTLKCHERVHTGERPFPCTLCSKSFKQSTHLMYHMRVHNKEKPYKCPYCTKSFTFNGNLTVHKRIHTGETPFVCNICGKGFYHSNNLKKHKKVHEKLNENVTDVSEASNASPEEEAAS